MVWACYEKREIGNHENIYRRRRLEKKWLHAIENNMRTRYWCVGRSCGRSCQVEVNDVAGQLQIIRKGEGEKKLNV